MPLPREECFLCTKELTGREIYRLGGMTLAFMLGFIVSELLGLLQYLSQGRGLVTAYWMCRWMDK